VGVLKVQDPPGSGNWVPVVTAGGGGGGGSGGTGGVSAAFVASSGNMASGAQSPDIVVTHNLNIASNRLNYTVVGHLEDGSWVSQCQWQVISRAANTVTIKFRNAGPQQATAVLRFNLLDDRGVVLGSGGGDTSPIGSVQAWGGLSTAIPTGWLVANGAQVSRTTYAALFAAIGTAHGVGDGSTTFNLPNLQGRVPVGLSSDTEFNTIGKTGGAKTHTLHWSEIPAHTHKFPGGANSITIGGTAYWFNQGASTPDRATPINDTGENPGGGAAHNNLQPYSTLVFIIKAGAGAPPPSLDTEWTNLTLLNGWLNFDSGLATGGAGRSAQVRKVAGHVFYQGVIRSGSTGNVAMFNIPVGVRPGTHASAGQHWACVSNSAFGAVVISAQSSCNFLAGSNAWFDLSGLSYPAQA